jgi:hypothetical protein
MTFVLGLKCVCFEQPFRLLWQRPSGGRALMLDRKGSGWFAIGSESTQRIICGYCPSYEWLIRFRIPRSSRLGNFVRFDTRAAFGAGIRRRAPPQLKAPRKLAMRSCAWHASRVDLAHADLSGPSRTRQSRTIADGRSPGAGSETTRTHSRCGAPQHRAATRTARTSPCGREVMVTSGALPIGNQPFENNYRC